MPALKPDTIELLLPGSQDPVRENGDLTGFTMRSTIQPPIPFTATTMPDLRPAIRLRPMPMKTRLGLLMPNSDFTPFVIGSTMWPFSHDPMLFITFQAPNVRLFARLTPIW